MTDRYFFSTHDFELAYNYLDIQPHQVYETNEKGIFYLLKEIIDNPDSFISSDMGSFIPIELGTDLDLIIERTRNMSGYDEPETWSPPKNKPWDKPKVEEPEKVLFDPQTNKRVDPTKHNGSEVTAKNYVKAI